MNKEKTQDSGIGICANPKHPKYNGLACLCAECQPKDEVCIPAYAGGGCSVCKGPVLECEGYNNRQKEE